MNIRSSPTTPKQLKLRSSCDPCGATKLKCDRGQPECGRCISLGQACVYGVSRKMGKPARNRLQIPDASGASRKSGRHTGSMDRNRHDHKTGMGGVFGSETVPESGTFPGVKSTHPGWDAFDDYSDSLMMSVDASDISHSDLFGLSFPGFTSLDSDSDLMSPNPEFEPISPPDTAMAVYSNSVAQVHALPARLDTGIGLDDSPMSPSDGSGHPCFREAYDILGSLSLHTLEENPSWPRSATSSAAPTPRTAHHVPLDRILRRNRECRERLGRILTCPCAKEPHLALLHASIIAKVLAWYQQAASCTPRASPSASDVPTAARLLCHLTPANSIPGSPSPAWSSTGLDTVHEGYSRRSNLLGASALAIAPTNVTMGSFDVEDQVVQAALNCQLLLGETKKTSGLIDLYTSRSSEGIDALEATGVDGLSENVSAFLRTEYSRVVDCMKSRLGELST